VQGNGEVVRMAANYRRAKKNADKKKEQEQEEDG
jgi:hypothetical protein